MDWPSCRSVFAMTAVASMLMTCFATSAQQVCQSIDDDTRRLVCYDQQGSGKTRKPVPAASKPVALRTFSREVVNCGRSFDSRVIMRVRCEKNKTSLTVGTLCHATRGGQGSFKSAAIRLDSGPASRFAGRSSTDRNSRPFWVASNPTSQLKRILGKSRLVVRLTPIGANAFNATFNVSNLSEKIKPLRQACGW